MEFTKDDLGYFIVRDAVKRHGSTKGFVTAEMDEHALAYILQGLTGRIGKMERHQEKQGFLPEDQKQFDYTKRLRDEIQSARNRTLPE